MNIFTPIRHNALRIAFAAYTRFWLKRFPRAVRIESTNACNADCTICPRRKMTRPVGMMDMDLYRKLISECAQHRVSIVHLHNYGEPLLDPNLYERIALARASSIPHVRIFTNGALLTPEVGANLIKSGLTELKVSIDGLDEQTFAAQRRGLKLAEISANLERFVQMRNKMRSHYPRVGIVFTRTRKNEAEADAFVKYWRPKVDKVFVSRVHNWGGKRQTTAGDLSLNPWPCLRLWTTFTVLWDGRAALCCMDYNGDVILGDTRHQTICDIFNGPELERIRACFLRGDLSEIHMCQTCTLHHRKAVRRGDLSE